MTAAPQRMALVTGASQGIGRATVLALAQAGCGVALAARNLAQLEAVAAEITGVPVCAIAMDVADPAQVSAGVKQAVERLGRIDILVNNAGITRDQLSLRMKREDWDAVLATNLTGAFLCCQAVMPGMVRNRWGRIINVTSVVAQSGNPGQANYVAAKAGLIGLTKSLALELASRQITVNAVAPGFISTAMTAGLGDPVTQALLTRIPMARIGDAAEVAAAICFLAGEAASYITGHTLAVNGGMYLA